MDLFSDQSKNIRGDISFVPLAERCRPNQLQDFIGHEEVIGSGTVLGAEIAKSKIKSMIFWGPPGVGKTTLARIIAKEVNAEFFSISAVTSGVRNLRDIIDRAVQLRKYEQKSSILFIDEIHRFNKAQQDALLNAVESGIVILIGATTENPSFEVISPLLSRLQVYQLKPLSNARIREVVQRAIKIDPILQKRQINVKDWESLYYLAGGDARRALNVIEKSIDFQKGDDTIIELNKQLLEKAAVRKVLSYDKSGEYHYDMISAFIKSIRGSDPDAAIYWMVRMLEAGEDPRFIARRMLILASEDIGNADPNALTLATSCFTAVTYVGLPEAKIILSQVAAYLATTPKSNSAIMALNRAYEDLKKFPDLPVPLHIRNAPTSLLSELGYGKDYKYVHDFPGHFLPEPYLPPELEGHVYYIPGKQGREERFLNRLKLLWGKKKKYDKDETD